MKKVLILWRRLHEKKRKHAQYHIVGLMCNCWQIEFSINIKNQVWTKVADELECYPPSFTELTFCYNSPIICIISTLD